MILSFKTHFQDGSPTFFEAQIIDGTKIHSLREDKKNRWEEGKYIHMCTGVRSKNYCHFNNGLTRLENCTGTQDVFMTYHKKQLEITVEDKYLYWNDIELLIKNDGLSREQFINWFFKRREEWSGKIIHWTNFRY